MQYIRVVAWSMLPRKHFHIEKEHYSPHVVNSYTDIYSQKVENRPPYRMCLYIYSFPTLQLRGPNSFQRDNAPVYTLSSIKECFEKNGLRLKWKTGTSAESSDLISTDFLWKERMLTAPQASSPNISLSCSPIRSIRIWTWKKKFAIFKQVTVKSAVAVYKVFYFQL